VTPARPPSEAHPERPSQSSTQEKPAERRRRRARYRAACATAAAYLLPLGASGLVGVDALYGADLLWLDRLHMGGIMCGDRERNEDEA